MAIHSGHWIFAGLFVLGFVVSIGYAYRDDIRKRPDLFKGSSRFVLGVILFVMILAVVKILHRLSS